MIRLLGILLNQTAATYLLGTLWDGVSSVIVVRPLSCCGSIRLHGGTMRLPGKEDVDCLGRHERFDRRAHLLDAKQSSVDVFREARQSVFILRIVEKHRSTSAFEKGNTRIMLTRRAMFG